MFDWDDANIEHIANHGIEPYETEEAILDPHRRVLPRRVVGAERRQPLIGRAESGRILFVVFTWRGRDIRVVTARDADTREKQRYRRSG